MRDCTIYVAKTKALINFAITAKLICVFVLAFAKSRFSHDAARILLSLLIKLPTELNTQHFPKCLKLRYLLCPKFAAKTLIGLKFGQFCSFAVLENASKDRMAYTVQTLIRQERTWKKLY